MDDRRAIEKCRAGETEAFGDLVKRYQAEAIGHAVAILASYEDALDAVQQAFFDAFRTLDRFDTSRRFYPWLYTILRNRCYKILARRTKQTSTRLDRIEIVAPAKKDCTASEASVVERALREISPQDRELLTLKHLDGLSYAELAERLEVPGGTVMSRLYYARKRLREKVVRIQNKADLKEISGE